jgi:hypothetical protein
MPMSIQSKPKDKIPCAGNAKEKERTKKQNHKGIARETPGKKKYQQIKFRTLNSAFYPGASCHLLPCCAGIQRNCFS